MLSAEIDLKSDVLKVAHHGSDSSSDRQFLNAVQPKYAVLSVGGDNSYGHPTEYVLALLAELQVQLYRTDMHGTVHCVSDGKQIIFDTEKTADEDPFLVIGGYRNYLDTKNVDRQMPDEEEIPKYIANMKSKKFHYPNCRAVKDMKDEHKLKWNGTRDELIAKGYVPCKICNP